MQGETGQNWRLAHDRGGVEDSILPNQQRLSAAPEGAGGNTPDLGLQ